VKFENGTLTVTRKKIKGYADYELVRKMRGSICIAGPLLARLQKARSRCRAAASSARGRSICI
jgi:UDP-N-acetylglucosamine enolpyruvyl transferase